MVRATAATLAFILTIQQALAFAPSSSGPSRVVTHLSATKLQEVKKTISSLNKDNFSASLAEVEPFLLNEAGITIYKKSIRRISTAAKALGVEVPAEFAKASKATQKRREKQDAFIQQKEAERMEAEASAVEEEEAPAVEEEAPAEA